MTSGAMVWLGDASVGSVVPEGEALVSVFDHGLTVGDGVFETVKVLQGVPFALTRHLRRLERSCDGIGLPRPDAGLLTRAIQETLIANAGLALDVARMRITVTAGPGPLGSDRTDSDVTIIIAISPQAPWGPTASVVTVPWTRNESGALVGVKSTSYAENVLALRFARNHGADEGIFLNTRGEACEGTGTNIFVVFGSTIRTPPLASGCLAGVTRDLVIEWCDAQEEHFDEATALTADEVFLTSSTRDVHPVVQWGDRRWPAPGPVTQQAAAVFAAKAALHLDP
jgi:branched-chain amino acid aminotransferase